MLALPRNSSLLPQRGWDLEDTKQNLQDFPLHTYTLSLLALVPCLAGLGAAAFGAGSRGGAVGGRLGEGRWRMLPHLRDKGLS